MVRPGYKQTEIGEIPEDWDCIPSGQAVAFIGGYGFSSSSATGSGIPWLKIANVGVGSVSWGASSYLPFNFLDKYKDFKLDAGDVVMALTRPILSNKLKVARILNDDAPSLLNQRVAKIQERYGYDKEYIYFVIQRKQFTDAMNLAMAGTDPPNIGTTALHKISIPVPPNISEQKAIAKALSDVDELIASLENLIAKKRDIKTATMQQLLTGKKRLPGFGEGKGYKQTELGQIPEDWDIDELNNVSTMHGRIGWQGLNQEEFTFNDSQPFLITGMNFKEGKIRWNEVYHIPEDRYALDRNIQLRDGDVLMTKDGTIGKILYVENIPFPYKSSLNSHLLVFRPKGEKYCPKFLYYVLKSQLFLDFIELNKSGSTFFGITQEAVGRFNAVLPPNDEQKAISIVLSDIDEDIEKTLLRLNKVRNLKQGMMQELLTGRTRLIKPHGTVAEEAKMQGT